MIILVILWTCVGVFVCTAVIAVLHLLGRLALPPKYGTALFSAVILEIAAIGTGVFSGKIDPTHLVQAAHTEGERDALARTQVQIRQLTDAAQADIRAGNYDAATAQLRTVFGSVLGARISAVADAFYLKGQIAEHRALWDDAAASYDAALEISSANPQLLISAAGVRLKKKDYDGARRLLDTADEIAHHLGDRVLEYRIANGRQNVERRYGAFLLEVGRGDSAEAHFDAALKILNSMAAIRPHPDDDVTEKAGRYRIYWEWRKYDEALAEVRALAASSPQVTYKEDLAAILIETGSRANVEEAYRLLGTLPQSTYVTGSLAEAAAIVETDPARKNAILAQVNQAIVADDPDNRDPYLHYVKALLLKSSHDDHKALEAISEAIRLEHERSGNFYTFDAVRMEQYNKLKAAWVAAR